jgi:hypothetical protein
MTKSTTIYINAELEWAEKQLLSWKDYVDKNPLHKMTDRPAGKMIISIEAQGKFIQETMKNYLALLEVVDKLREKETVKKEARGNGEVPHRMQMKKT